MLDLNAAPHWTVLKLRGLNEMIATDSDRLRQRIAALNLMRSVTGALILAEDEVHTISGIDEALKSHATACAILHEL